MKYVMVLCILAAIVILCLSLIDYEKIKKHLKAEIYSFNQKYQIISGIYRCLICFFILAYLAFLIFWIRHPSYEMITCVVISLLFFGSIFVGLSVMVLGQSLDVVLGVKLNEMDTMTGLMTKNSFERKVNQLLREGHGTYMLVVMDLDKFKRINDAHGHGKGDEVILAAAKVIQNAVRSRDMVGRFGGDEFMILLENTQESQLCSIMKRIEEAIVTEEKRAGCSECSGISYGAALMKAGSGEKYTELFETADQKLYEMKKKKS